MTEPDRDYFPQPAEPTLVLLDARLLMRGPADTPTFTEVVGAICRSREEQTS